MKILVTGGAGFIGSHVVDHYIQAGHEVIVLDNLSSGRLSNIHQDAKFYLADLCQLDILKQIFEIEKPDIINHHAAQISVPLSVKDPALDAKINVMGFLNLLNCGVENNVQKVIYISSGGAIYGEAEQYPTTELYPPQPLSPYAISKSVGENYLAFYSAQFGLKYTVLRYANVYGPRQSPEGEAGVVSIFMTHLLKNKTATIYAYPDQPDGMIRDYVFVKDVARANLLVLDQGEGEAINIASRTETNTKQLYQIICQIMKKNCQPGWGEARKGDLTKSCLNIDKASQYLNWHPDYKLQDGLKETYHYFNEMS